MQVLRLFLKAFEKAGFILVSKNQDGFGVSWNYEYKEAKFYSMLSGFRA